MLEISIQANNVGAVTKITVIREKEDPIIFTDFTQITNANPSGGLKAINQVDFEGKDCFVVTYNKRRGVYKTKTGCVHFEGYTVWIGKDNDWDYIPLYDNSPYVVMWIALIKVYPFVKTRKRGQLGGSVFKRF